MSATGALAFKHMSEHLSNCQYEKLVSALETNSICGIVFLVFFYNIFHVT